MSLLISNDDGVYAPGLEALYQALTSISKVSVIAPDRNHSGASNALTLENPLRIQQLSNGFIAVNHNSAYLAVRFYQLGHCTLFHQFNTFVFCCQV